MSRFSLIPLSFLTLGLVAYLAKPARYTTDLGNGVTIVADAFVKSGEWAYHCKRVYLVKRDSMEFPAESFVKHGRVLPGLMLQGPQQRAIAKALLDELVKRENWHDDLQYAYSGINEQDALQSHFFWLPIHHEGLDWVIWVRQSLASTRRHHFYISAKPYDPATHRTHQHALSEAMNSCPYPQ